MPAQTPRITVVGSLNMDMVTVTDIVPKGGETIMAKSFSTGCGGKGANQAIAAARLSRIAAAHASSSQAPLADVRMVGAVGDDAFGQQLRDNLSKAGCDVTAVTVVQGTPTGTATILVEEDTGENRILVAAGANGHLAQPSDDTVNTDLVLAQLECPIETIFAYLNSAHSRQARVILNPSPARHIPEDILRCVDYLVVNESEARLLSGVALKAPFDNDDQLHIAADALISKGATCIIITLGGEGVFYKCSRLPQEKMSRRFRSKPVKVVDSTGAGDTFVGAFAVRLASANHPADINEQNVSTFVEAMHEAITFGMDAAALAIQKRGAQDSIAVLDDLPDWKTTSAAWVKSV